MQESPTERVFPSLCEGLPRALSSPDSDGINQTATVGQKEKLEPEREAGRTPMREAVRKEGETSLGNRLDESREGGGAEEREESKQAPRLSAWLPENMTSSQVPSSQIPS